MIRHYNIPIFIPQMGCPFQCIFCNQNQIASVNSLPDSDNISKIIEDHLETISRAPRNVQVAFFGGSFTGLPINVQIDYLKSVRVYINSGQVSSVRISTRPDFISKEILEMLKTYNVAAIELGAQSLDDEVLRLSGRGHTADEVIQASNVIKDHGFSLGLQMMVGLPGDTKEKALLTAKKIIDAGADHTRIYPALVIKNTRLERWFQNKKFQPLSLNESLEWISGIMELFEQANVKILRVGLHPSEGLLKGDSLVAGPFHVSYRELVLSHIWRKKLETVVQCKSDVIHITVPPHQINYAVGHGGQNKTWLGKRFGQVKFKTDKTLKDREFHISYA